MPRRLADEGASEILSIHISAALSGIAVGTLERTAIVHTHAQPERIAELCALAAGLLPQRDILSADITPVTGAIIGPGAVGFAVVAGS